MLEAKSSKLRAESIDVSASEKHVKASTESAFMKRRYPLLARFQDDGPVEKAGVTTQLEKVRRAASEISVQRAAEMSHSD